MVRGECSWTCEAVTKRGFAWGNQHHCMWSLVTFLLLCRLDTLRKGMQDSADRIRKLEREYQVGWWAPASMGHRAVLTCHLCCN